MKKQRYVCSPGMIRAINAVEGIVLSPGDEAFLADAKARGLTDAQFNAEVLKRIKGDHDQKKS